MLALRPYHAAADGPDRLRPLLQRGPRSRDRLRDRHPAGQPRRHGRGGLPAPDLPARPRRGREPVRGGPRAAGSTSSSGGRRPARSSPTRRATPRRSRWATPTVWATSRPSTRACCCSTSPRTATSSARPASPPPRPGIGRFARLPHLLRSLDTAIAARGRPGRRPDAVRRRADGPSRGPRDHRGGDRAERHARDPQHERHPDREGRPVRGRARHGSAAGSRSISSSTASSSTRHLYHRGEDLRDIKAEALRRLAAERVFTTLAVAVAEGVNDHEVGAIADYALGTDYIAGVAFQPVFGSGRIEPDRPDAARHDDRDAQPARRADRRSRRAGRLHRLAVLASRLLVDHLLHPRRQRGVAVRAAACSATDRLKEYLGLVSNRIAPDDAMWTALVGMMSETTLVSRPELVDHLLRVCEACDLGVTGFVKNLGRWLFDREARRRGDRAAGQALLGQVVHGCLDAERRAAPAMLRPRRLDRRRGEPGARPVLCPAAVRWAATDHIGGHGAGARARPARRRPRAGDPRRVRPHERRTRGHGRARARTSGRR